MRIAQHIVCRPMPMLSEQNFGLRPPRIQEPYFVRVGPLYLASLAGGRKRGG